MNRKVFWVIFVVSGEPIDEAAAGEEVAGGKGDEVDDDVVGAVGGFDDALFGSI